MADLEGRESIEIDAPVEHCFAIASDVERAPEWHGAMKAADAIEYDGDGRPALVKAKIDAMVASVKVDLRFAYTEPHAVKFVRESGDLKSLIGTWHFEPIGDDRTLAVYSLEIGLNRALALLRKGVRGPAEAKVRDLLARRPVEGLKRAAEA